MRRGIAAGGVFDHGNFQVRAEQVLRLSPGVLILPWLALIYLTVTALMRRFVTRSPHTPRAGARSLAGTQPVPAPIPRDEADSK